MLKGKGEGEMAKAKSGYAVGKNPNSHLHDEDLIRAAKFSAEETARFKEIAEKRRKNYKYKQEFTLSLYDNIKAYMAKKHEDGSPLTISGLILACGIPKQSWQDLRNGNYDHALYMYCEYHNIDLDNGTFEQYDGMPIHADEDGNKVLLVPISQIVERALLMQEEETETRLYEKGRVGDIFSLKAKHGWQEEQKVTNNNTLVIASETDARKALKLLSEE